MALRKVARFRTPGRAPGDPTLLQRLQLTGGFTLVSLAALAIAGLLVAAPFYWTSRAADQMVESWSKPVFAQVEKVESHWMTLPHVPAFSRGDEPELRRFLAAQPLIVALQDRSGLHSLWVRQGDRLVPAQETVTVQAYRRWFTQAEAEQRFVSHPLEALPAETRSGPKIVLLGDRWMVAKWWPEGSSQVEATLRLVLGQACAFRLGIIRPNDDGRRDFRPQPWGGEPNLQADPARMVRRRFSAEFTSSDFQGWIVRAIPQIQDSDRLARGLRIKRALAGCVAGLIGASLALGLYLRRRAMQKAALDADRLASMTHSLKTPLAILKVRCDTIRLGRLSQDEVDAQLIRLGEEADRLSCLIENGLAAIQGLTNTGPRGEVTRAWLEGIAEDLAPAFQAEGRNLVLELAPAIGLAPLASLRSGLLTLLENALFHGRGTVTLETARKGDRFTLKITDQGPGLGASQLKALGKPYLRLRAAGKEGFQREGQGLGLSLLCKVAEQEGWGLSFASEPGRGLAAILEIPGAPACA
jgi:signal transduction histidine kinase